MAKFRNTLIVFVVLALAGALIWFLRDDLGRRAQPPQASMATMSQQAQATAEQPKPPVLPQTPPAQTAPAQAPQQQAAEAPAPAAQPAAPAPQQQAAAPAEPAQPAPQAPAQQQAATAPAAPATPAPPTQAVAPPGSGGQNQVLPPGATGSIPPPPKPEPLTPALLAIHPSFDVVRIGSDCRAVMAGRAAPNALVTVYFGDDELGRINADPRGEWTLVPDLPLHAGSRELRLTSALQGQTPAQVSINNVVVAVPNCEPGKSGGEQAIAVLTGPTGGSRVLQKPVGKTAVGKGLSLDTVDYDDKGELVLSGRAPAQATVQIYINNEPVAVAKADPKGVWTAQPTKQIAPGVYTLRIDQMAEPGKPGAVASAGSGTTAAAPQAKVASRIELPFSRAAPGSIDFAQGNVVVQPGNSLWRIARQLYGEGTRYMVIYGANKEQIRDPDMIYPGQVFSLPKDPGTKQP